MNFRLFPLSLLMVSLLLGGMIRAQEPSIAASKPSIAHGNKKAESDLQKRVFKIAVSERPPYSMKNNAGVWEGVGISLWEEIAQNLGLKYEYVICIQDQMHELLKRGEIDIIAVTGESTEHLDVLQFTQPYLFSKTAAAVPHLSVSGSIENITKHLSESGMFKIVLSMFLAMFLISVLLVFFEGRRENGHFEQGTVLSRFASALWYTAVTMTSVGYGDTSRLSAIGRMLTFLWMLMGILFVALFTGSVVSAITTNDINASIIRADDLLHYRNGCLAGTKLERFLLSKGVPVKKFPSYEEGFAALSRGGINAFAGDALSENYVINNDYPGQFKICPFQGVSLVYAMALREGDPDYRVINKALEKIVFADDWNKKMERWTGALNF